MRYVAVAVGLVAAFWAGYSLCAYRAFDVVFPTLLQSYAISNAATMTKLADLLDHDGAPSVRAKLLTIAKVSADFSPVSAGYSLKGFLRGPLESTAEVVETTQQLTAPSLAAARADIARLCRTSPDTDAYRYVCGR